MNATILLFPIVARSAPPSLVRPVENVSAPFTPAWCKKHVPLIDAAMDLLSADDAEFARRCALTADDEGRSMLDDLAGQVDRLGANFGIVAESLVMTGARIRQAMSLGLARTGGLEAKAPSRKCRGKSA